LNQQYLDQRGSIIRRLGLTKKPQQPQQPPRFGEIVVQLGLLSAEEVERHAQACYHRANTLFDD